MYTCPPTTPSSANCKYPVRACITIFREWLFKDRCYIILIISSLYRLNPVGSISISSLIQSNLNPTNTTILNILDLLPDCALIVVNRYCKDGIGDVMVFAYATGGMRIIQFAYIGIQWTLSQDDGSYMALITMDGIINVLTALTIILPPIYMCLLNNIDGYEALLINSVRAIYNISVMIANYIGQNYLQEYLENRYYSPKAVGYMMIFGIELSLLLSTLVYLFIPSTPPLSSPPTAIHSNSDHKSLEESRLTRPQ